MNSTELLQMFRKDVVDLAQPQLWDDAEIYGYLNSAQNEFCRNTTGIGDMRTPAVTQIAVVPGTDWYPTHRSILHIRKAARIDNGRKVELLTSEQADIAGIVFGSGRVGKVQALVLGLEPHVVRVHPMPNETVTIQLAVFRLPLVPITDAGDQRVEIDVHHHESLLLWMKHRAYDKPDDETYDRRKSDFYRDRFKAYCAQAKLDEERARRVFGTIAYGGL